MVRNEQAFFALVRKHFGRLTQMQVDGFKAIIAAFEKHGDGDPRKLAYLFATAWHETGRKLGPIPEGGRGRGKTYGQPAGPYGHVYYGRGLVQLTWYDNYLQFERLLGHPLVRNPDIALDVKIAADILVIGSMRGMFRPGHSLTRYFPKDGAADPIRARLVINGIPKGQTMPDKADTIRDYYAKFLAILEDKTVLQALIPILVGEAIKQATSRLVADPNVPDVNPSTAPTIQRELTREVQEAVAEKVTPRLEHLANQEPWYQSRVTLGAIASILAGAAGLAGWSVGAEELTQVLVALVPIAGGALSLYGRWKAKRPLGT